MMLYKVTKKYNADNKKKRTHILKMRKLYGINATGDRVAFFISDSGTFLE